MHRTAPGSLSLLLLAGSLPVWLSACNASLLESGRPATPSQPIASNPSKATPVITWPKPAPITNPTPLGAAQLDATANVAGTFVYSPAAGMVLAAGTQTLSAVFTPADTADYNTATATVTILVNSASAPPIPPTSGSAHLLVADAGNCRILFYDAPFTSGESASLVLGQTGFDYVSPCIATSASANSMAPDGIAMDSAGNLYEADSFNCRVLQFQPPFTEDMNASIVFGQSQFISDHEDCKGGASGMKGPVSVAVDSHGDLWVSDFQAGRVTEYVPPFADGMPATVAIGQISVDNTYFCNGQAVGNSPPTLSTLCSPYGIAFDAEGDLWVADGGNFRVLEFMPPFTTGMAASLELGQPASGTSATSVGLADGLAFDSAGDLWVGDPWDCRVLEFVPPFSTGMAASVVLGQPNFTNPPPCGGMAPFGLTFDSNGNLIVANSAVEGVMIFSPPFHTGMSATEVIGRHDAKEDGCGFPAADTLCDPWGVLVY